jgi:tetratricopeptide (TPR) repeat protein
MDPQQVRQKIKSLLIFIGYNLVYGAAGSVDNSAHMGGLVAGLILGSLAPAILRRADVAIPAADPMAPNSSPAVTPSAPVAMTELAPEEMSHVDRVTGLIAVGGVVVLLAAVLWIHGRNIPGTHYGKAIRFVQAGQVKQGMDELEQAVSLGPSLFFPSALLGELQLQQGNAQGAITPLERSAALAPEIFYVEQNLALAYLGVGRPRDALREIGSAMEHAKAISWRAQYITGLAAEQSGNSQLATDSFKSVIQSNPDFREARQALARLSAPASAEPAAPIPFSELVFKSPAWPVYP